jgi:hypothetical protein
MDTELNNPKAAFYVKIEHCKVYFNPVIGEKSSKISLTSLPGDVIEEFKKKDSLLFDKYKNTFICKAVKNKAFYTPFIDVKFGKMYSIFNTKMEPIAISDIKKGVHCSAVIWAKEWHTGNRAGYTYNAETIIVDQ